MRAIKLVLGGVFALFTLSQIARLFMMLSGAGGALPADPSQRMGYIAGTVMMMVVFAAIAFLLLKSSLGRPRNPTL